MPYQDPGVGPDAVGDPLLDLLPDTLVGEISEHVREEIPGLVDLPPAETADEVLLDAPVERINRIQQVRETHALEIEHRIFLRSSASHAPKQGVDPFLLGAAERMGARVVA